MSFQAPNAAAATAIASAAPASIDPVTENVAAATPQSTGDASSRRSGARAGIAPREIGGREGPEPTRYGDWELRGRCIDF